MGLDDFLEQIRHPCGHGGRGLVDEVDREDDAAINGQRVVGDFLFQQLAVGNDLLFARQRAQARALHADLFDPRGGRVIGDRVAPAERLVEDDRDGREQVGKNALCGKADGDTADAKTCNQARDVHAQIVEDDDGGDGKQREADRQADQHHGAGQRIALMLAVADAPFDEAENDLAQPHRDLDGDRDGEQHVHGTRQHIGRVGVAVDDLDRDHHAEEFAGPRKRARDDGFELRTLLALPRDLRRDAFEPAQQQEHDHRSGDRNSQLNGIALHPGDQRGPVGFEAGEDGFGVEAGGRCRRRFGHVSALRWFVAAHNAPRRALFPWRFLRH